MGITKRFSIVPIIIQVCIDRDTCLWLSEASEIYIENFLNVESTFDATIYFQISENNCNIVVLYLSLDFIPHFKNVVF